MWEVEGNIRQNIGPAPIMPYIVRYKIREREGSLNKVLIKMAKLERQPGYTAAKPFNRPTTKLHDTSLADKEGEPLLRNPLIL